MRDPAETAANMACEPRARRGSSFSEIPFSCDIDPTSIAVNTGEPLRTAVTHFSDLIDGPNGQVEIIGKIPENRTSAYAALILPGFLGRGFLYSGFCEAMASQGVVTAVVDRSSPETTAKSLDLIAQETGCTTFHVYGHSHGGSDGVELVEFVDGENVASLTMAGTRSLRTHGSVQMLARSVSSLRQIRNFIPAFHRSVSRDPAGFIFDSIRYADYIASNFPEHIRHGLGEVATINVSERLSAIRTGGKVAVAGMYCRQDAMVLEKEAAEFERDGHFDIFHWVSDPNADHCWTINHPDEAALEYRYNILDRLDPVFDSSKHKQELDIAA